MCSRGLDKYSKMRDEGRDAGEVYLAAKQDGYGFPACVKLLRWVFGLSLTEAKEVALVTDGKAKSLTQHQEGLLPDLTAALKQMQADEEGGAKRE